MDIAYPSEIVVERRAQDLPTEVIRDLQTDRDGWLWIGTHAGLFRHDGRRSHRWGGTGPAVEIADILAVDGERVTVLTGSGTLEVHTPDARLRSAPLDGVVRAVVDGTGALWALNDEGLWRQRGEDWRRVEVAAGWLWADREGAWVSQEGAAVLLGEDGAERRRVAMPVPRAVAPAADGGTWFVADDRRVLHLGADGGLEARGQLDRTGVTELLDQGGTLWIGLGTGLEVLPPAADEPTDLGLGPDLMGAMALASSADGLLWIGAMQGLFALPSPGTRRWTERHGLADRGIRALALDGEGVLLSTWRRPARVERRVEELPLAYAEGEVCRDGAGRPRVGGVQVYQEPPELFDPTTGERWPLPEGTVRYWDCATASDGGLWLGTNLGVVRVDPDGGVRRTDLPPLEVIRVYEDGQGRLWASSWEDVVRADVSTLAAGGATWTRETLPPGARITDLLEVEGHLWATSTGGGLLERQADGWSTLEPSSDLPTRDLLWMSPSPRGGAWLAGHGTLLRARPTAGGFEVVERLGSAQGVATTTGSHVVEADDGTLWVATASGLVRVPADARRPAEVPPAPVLEEVRVAGATVSGALDLAWKEGPLDLVYGVTAYRDPRQLRYRLRTGPDEPWSPPTDTPEVHLYTLPVGTMSLQLQAASGESAWSEPSAPLAVVVRPPWYRRWWVQLGGVTALAGIAALAAWVRGELRLRVERERSRIALDLHDELGSGLGSITVLAGLAAEPDVDEEARRSAARDAAGAASELARAVQDIVWSLRRDAGDAAALIAWLSERGRRLFADGSAGFRVEAPPSDRLGRVDLRVRRQVQLVVAEALHNAARHARAGRVVLRVIPGPRWRIEVEDDGRGLDTEPSEGNGLPGIRARAERIGAEVRWEPVAGGGTRFAIVFDPAGRWRVRRT